MTRSDHEFVAPELMAAITMNFESAGRHRHNAGDPSARCVDASVQLKTFLQRAQQPQRISVAVMRTIGCARDSGTDLRELFTQSGPFHDFIIIAVFTGLIPQLLQQGQVVRKLLLIDRDVKPARAMVFDGYPRLRMELFTERCPGVGRAQTPAGIVGHAKTLALYPDQTEVAACRPNGVITFIN